MKHKYLWFSVLFINFFLYPVYAGEFYSGDIIEVNIWHNEDISGKYEIDKDGYITMPLVGRIKVSNMDTFVLQQTVA